MDNCRFVFVVDIGYGCFTICFSDRGICTEAPPMARWMRGKTLTSIQCWVSKKKGTIEEIT